MTIIDTGYKSGCREVTPSPAVDRPPSICTSFLEIFDPTLYSDGLYLSLCDRIGEFFDAIAEAISGLFQAIFGPPYPGFITREMISALPAPAELADDKVAKLLATHTQNLITMFNRGNRDFSRLLQQLTEDGLSDAQVNVIARNAFRQLNVREGFKEFKDTFRAALYASRYERLLTCLHNQRHTPMEVVDNPGMGNCFLYSCSNGLKRITDGAERISHSQLRHHMTKKAKSFFSSNDAKGREFRQQFINHLIAGEEGEGKTHPQFEYWEEKFIQRYPNHDDILAIPHTELQDAIAALPVTIKMNPGNDQTNPLSHAQRFRAKLLNEPQAEEQRVRDSTRFDPWEIILIERFTEDGLRGMTDAQIETGMGAITFAELGEDNHKMAANLRKKLQRQQQEEETDDHLEAGEIPIFVDYGKDYILDKNNTTKLLECMRTNGFEGGEKLLRLRQRIKKLYNDYTHKLSQPGVWNGGLEALIAAHVLKRAIVVLQWSAGNKRWEYRTIAGKEYLRSLENIRKRPPITVLHSGGHYTTGFYPRTLPPPPSAPRQAAK